MKTYPLKTVALRLHPGDDLRGALEAYARTHRIKAAFVLSCIGSLSVAALRKAGRPRAIAIKGEFEIITMNGSLSEQGAHLHAVIADNRGKVTGGHVSLGCVVRTTAEILLGLMTGVRFDREPDANTGYPELTITSLRSRQSRKSR